MPLCPCFPSVRSPDVRAAYVRLTPDTCLPSIVGALIDGAIELFGQLGVDEAHVVPLLRREGMVAAATVGLVALALVAGLEDEVITFDRDPDVLARIAIPPLQQETLVVLVEATEAVQVVAVELVQNVEDVAIVYNAPGLCAHLGGGALIEVFGRYLKLTGGALRLEDHLRYTFGFVIVQ